MSNPSGEVIGRILIAIFGVFVLMFSFIVLAIEAATRDARQKARSDALSQKARDVGLAFAPVCDIALARKYHFLDHFGKASGGSNPSCVNVITGTFEEHPVTIFDYYYVTAENRVWWWAPSWEKHCYLSFFIVDMNSTFPELTIAKEGFFSKIAQAVGYRDIDFESHEFSKRYVVRSKSKKFAYDFCNARMIDYLLDQPIMTIEIENNALALAFDDPHEVGLTDSRLRHIASMRSLMPDYLFDEGYGGPEREVPQSNSPIAPIAPIVPDSSESIAESDASERSHLQSDMNGYRWFAFYRGYLLLAALSGLVALRYGFALTSIANSAWFIFALYTLRKPNEASTRKLHIAINLVALIFSLMSLAGLYIPFLGFLSWIPVPHFNLVLPYFGGVVQLVPIVLSFVWYHFWVNFGRS